MSRRATAPWPNTKPPWRSTKTETWFRYLSLPPKDSWIWAWYVKRAHLDTGTLWTAIRKPVLLVYGQQDQLMPVDQTIRRLEDVLDATSASIRRSVVPRAEHNLSVHPAASEPFFWWRMQA